MSVWETQEYVVCQGIPSKLKVWASISLPKSLASLGHGHVFHMFKAANCDQLGAKRPGSRLPPLELSHGWSQRTL